MADQAKRSEADRQDVFKAADEIDHILDTLQELLRGAASPVVKLCLEEAHADIAHLTSRDERTRGKPNVSGAA
jgi:hypothetical protein